MDWIAIRKSKLLELMQFFQLYFLNPTICQKYLLTEHDWFYIAKHSLNSTIVVNYTSIFAPVE